MKGGLLNETTRPGLTTIRQEVKYLFEPQEAQKRFAMLGKRIPEKIVGGCATSYRVSVYLDTSQYDLCRAELQSNGRSVKLRVKDYYLYDGYRPVIGDKYWLEAKVRVGTTVEKSRFAVEKRAVEKALQHGITERLSPREQEAAEAFETIRNGRTLFPVFIVHYRRTTLQDTELNLRLTFDEIVTYHRPLKGLFVLYDGISRQVLPPPLKVETKWVVELKVSGSVPPFIEEILDPARQVNYSKFGVGVRELERIGLLR